MGDFMQGIKLVSVCSYSFTDRKTIRVCYDSGEHVVYREIVDLYDLPASVQKFIIPENYDSCDFEFLGPSWSCLSIFRNTLFDFPILHVTDLDSEEDEPEEDETEDDEKIVVPDEGVCPYPTAAIYGGCPVSCKYSLGFSDQCALDLMSLQVPEFDLEIYVSGAYDCTLEQTARVCVGVHGCPTEFHDLEAYTDNQGYMNIIVDAVYNRFPFLQFCSLPVLRDSHEYQELGKRHVVELWKIPLPSHYSYTSIHRVWRGCGSL